VAEGLQGEEEESGWEGGARIFENRIRVLGQKKECTRMRVGSQESRRTVETE
jgi:hypothetical protein